MFQKELFIIFNLSGSRAIWGKYIRSNGGKKEFLREWVVVATCDCFPTTFVSHVGWLVRPSVRPLQFFGQPKNAQI